MEWITDSHKRTARRTAALVAAAVLVLGSCSSDDSSNDAVSTTAGDGAPTSVAATGPASNSADTSAAPGLGETNWTVVTYSTDGAITELWPGTEITIEFDTDGTVTGSGGCNNYNGTFEVDGPYDEFGDGVRGRNDGQAIAMGPFAATEKACTSPSGVMDQETEFLTSLASVGRWLISRDQLLLRTDDGLALIEAGPAG
jgi:heat shock protein HslJ